MALMKRLAWIGGANVVLGAFSLVRLVAEILAFRPSYFDSRVTALFMFDAMVATLWISSGLCLLFRHSAGPQWAAISAGAACARTVLSIAPALSISAWDFNPDGPDLVLSGMAARFLHYGLEFAYWPVVLYLIFWASDRDRSGSDREYMAGASFAATGVSVATLQVAILATLG